MWQRAAGHRHPVAASKGMNSQTMPLLLKANHAIKSVGKQNSNPKQRTYPYSPRTMAPISHRTSSAWMFFYFGYNNNENERTSSKPKGADLCHKGDSAGPNIFAANSATFSAEDHANSMAKIHGTCRVNQFTILSAAAQRQVCQHVLYRIHGRQPSPPCQFRL